MKRWAHPGLEPYIMGLTGFVLAFLLRYVLQPVLEDHLPMFFFGINCIVLAFYYGARPSLLFLVISLPTAIYFFTKPFNSFSIVAESDIFISAVYFTLVGLTAIMIERLRQEQYKSSLLARVSDSR